MFPFAALAVGTHPDFIELGGGVSYEIVITTQHSGFEVAGIFAFHTEAGTGEICRTNVGCF